MRPLRYAINVTLDGCCHHEAGLPPDEESMRWWADELRRADAVVFGRTTYAMMEAAWRKPADGVWPGWVQPWQVPFGDAVDAAPKYVVSSTLTDVDWNAELLDGDLVTRVRDLKEQPGRGLFVGGVTLPPALARAGLIDEYALLVHPVLAGHGPRLAAGLADHLTLSLVQRDVFRSGVTALRYRPTDPGGDDT